MVYLANHKGAQIPIREHVRRDWARIHFGSYGVHSIDKIHFEADGRFLPETQGGAHTFPLEGLDRHYSLQVTFHKSVETSIPNLEDQASIMKCNLRGIVSLFPPTNNKDRRRSLPSLYLPEYNLPVGDILKEVCLIAFIRTLYANMHCIRYSCRVL
jgi:hypothetical protein